MLILIVIIIIIIGCNVKAPVNIANRGAGRVKPKLEPKPFASRPKAGSDQPS